MPKVHIESNSPSIGYNPPQQVLAAGVGAAPFQAAISASRQEAGNWGNIGALGGKLFEAGLLKVRQEEETAALGALNRLAVAEAEARASLMQEFTLGSADQGRVEYNARMQKARDEILQSSGIKYRLGADVFNRRADDLLSRGEAAWAGYEAGERRKFRLLTLDENTAVIANSVSSGELSVTDGYGQSADGIDRVLADWPEASRLVYKKHAAAQITLAEVNRLARNGDYTAAKGVLSGNKGLFSTESFRENYGKLEQNERAESDLSDFAAAYNAGKTPAQFAVGLEGGGDFAGLPLERQTDIAMEAISGQESGGDYGAENGRTKAYGRFQIMPGNWPVWSKEAGLAGAEPTPENQDKVARYKIGQYLKEYNGDLRKAAVAWYAGPGAVDNPKYDYDKKQGAGDEPSINEYADSIVSRADVGGGIAFKRQGETAGYTAYYNQRRALVEGAMATAKTGAANDIYLLAKEGRADPVTVLTAVNKALNASGLTGRDRVTLERELSALAAQGLSAPNESDTPTIIELQKMDRNDTLKQETVDAAYKRGALSTTDYISLSDKALKILKDEDDKVTKAADRQIDAYIDETFPGEARKARREKIKAGIFDRLDASGLKGYDRVAEAQKYIREEKSAPGSAVNWWTAGQLEVEQAAKSWGEKGPMIVTRIRDSLLAATRHQRIPGQEVNRESSSIAYLISEGNRKGDYTWQTVFDMMLREGSLLTLDNFRKKHDDYLNDYLTAKYTGYEDLTR